MKFSVNKFIIDVITLTRKLIIKYESVKDLQGHQKKDRVDAIVIEEIKEAIKQKGCPLLFRFLINKYVLKNIPDITQKIFDLIKDNVQGITN